MIPPEVARLAEDPGWEPHTTAMATVTPPPPGGDAVARRAESYEEFRATAEIAYTDAVARGRPRWPSTAGAMSRPILERLGFEAVTSVEVLLDGPR